MKLADITYQPQINVLFTPEEFEVLFECGKNHYDLACKKAVEPGGILWGAKNMADEEFPPVLPYPFTWRELDLVSKIIEQSTLLYRSSRDQMMIAAEIMAGIEEVFETTKRVQPNRYLPDETT